MNVILVDSVDFPFGGAHSVHVGLLMKGLRENQENAFLVIPYGRKREAISNTKRKYGHFDGVPYCFMRYSRKVSKGLRFLDIFFGVINTARLLYRRRKKGKLDAVILGGIVDIFRDSPIILTCKICRIPLYFWLVEKASLNEDFRGIAGVLNKKSQELSEKFLPWFAKGVIVISANLKKHYMQYLPESRILINPILVSEDSHRKIDWQAYHKTEEKLRDLYKDKRLLVYSGSFGEKDGIFILIEALAKVIRKYPDTFMVMTGKNDNEQLMDEVRKHIRRLQLENNTRLVGFVNADELLCYNSMADILFVCRSNSAFANHGFPWKLGEYCMTSKPVIATDVSDIRVYFTDNQDLFIVEPGSPDAIAGKVLEIFGHYEHALDVARQGRAAALSHFGYLPKAGDVARFIHANQSN